jgi:hypothetical protein
MLRPAFLACLFSATVYAGDSPELIEFALNGNAVDQQPLLFRFRAYPIDLDASPDRGQYYVTTFRLTIGGNPQPLHGIAAFTLLDVALSGTQDTVQFFAEGSTNGGLGLDLRFPSGTLTSDALPLSLPMEQATRAFLLEYALGPVVIGTITSYQAVPVPEASCVLPLAVASYALWRVRR